MTVRVRPATVNDASWVADVSRASFAAQLHDYLISAQPGVERFWEVVLAHPASYPDRCLVVAEDGDVRLGFADLTLVAADRAHLSYVCVIESARGRGLAAELLRAYVDRHPQAVTMQLDVFIDNAPARALYERLGFSVESTTTWWVADLALGLVLPAVDARLEGLHTAQAWMSTYGFGELFVALGDRTVRLGRPSAHVLRCFDPATLDRPALVAAVVAQLPEVDRVLVLAPGSDPPSSAIGVPRAVNQTLRMSTSEIRTRLEPR